MNPIIFSSFPKKKGGAKIRRKKEEKKCFNFEFKKMWNQIPLNAKRLMFIF